MENTPLRFHDGIFTILTISDMHGGDLASPQLKEGIDCMIDTVHPDMVYLLGDQVDTRAVTGHFGKEELRRYLEDEMGEAISLGIPWAHVFGNHDKAVMDCRAQQEVYEGCRGCISCGGDENIPGVSNYVLTVYDEKGEKPLFNLFGLDTLTNSEYYGIIHKTENEMMVLKGLGSYDESATLSHEQVNWYWSESRRLEGVQGKVPSLVFLHIPIPEMSMMVSNSPLQGSNRERCLGHTQMNSGLFFAMMERDNVKGIFCGHCHNIDLCGSLCGITMAYDAGMGYNNNVMDDDMRGGRIITLHESGEIDTSLIKILPLMGDRCRKDKARIPKK